MLPSLQEKMKKQLISLTLISISTVALISIFAYNRQKNSEKPAANTPAQGIRFIEEDYQKALAAAKQQNKLIFIDAYAVWCGPCKLLKRKTFPNKKAGDFFNRHFISVAVDMEKGQGPALAAQYAVNAYPTLLITDATGKLLAYTKGFMSAEQLIEFGQFGINQSIKSK